MRETVHKGFLLIHCIIIIAIISFLVTLSIPHNSWFNRLFVRYEIEQFFSLFHYLQQTAMVHNQEQYIMFDELHNTYTINSKTHRLAKGVQFGIFTNCYGPPSDPKQLLKKPITFPGSKVIFYPDGTISSGTMYLTDSKKDTLYSLTVPVGNINFLRLYRYQQKWQLLV